MERDELFLENSFTCSICLDVLENPKSLLCGHNFCGKCLKLYLKQQNERCPGIKWITCPECREKTAPPDPLRPVCEWSEQFKINCGIQKAIQGFTDKKRKDCDVCTGEGNEVESSHFCKTCKLTLCRRCHTVHKKIPACRQHDVQQTSTSQLPVCKRYDFRIHLNTCASFKQRSQQSMRLKKELKQRIEMLCEQAAESVKQKGLQINKQADVMVDELFERFNSYHPYLPSSMNSASYIDEEEQKFQTVVWLLSKVEPFVNSKCEESIAKLQIQVDFNDKDSTAVKQVGGSMSLSTEEADVDIEEIEINVQDEEGSSSGSSSEEDFIPVFETTIESMTEEDDDDPWIRNILIMSSCDTETVIVTDYNNYCVKSFYKDEDIAAAKPYETSRLVLGGRPWGLTELQNERIAVTVPERKAIYIIRVQPELKKLTEIKVSREFYGIATLSYTSLIASAAKDPSPGLCVVDFSGRILKTIEKDRKGRNLFEAPYYIAKSDRDDIVVAEDKSRRLLFVTKGGQLRDRDISSESYQPRTLYGIACDDLGNLFLADREASKVVCVREGQDDKVFLTQDEGIRYPRCVGLYGHESMYVVEEGGAIKKFCLV